MAWSEKSQPKPCPLYGGFTLLRKAFGLYNFCGGVVAQKWQKYAKFGKLTKPQDVGVNCNAT